MSVSRFCARDFLPAACARYPFSCWSCVLPLPRRVPPMNTNHFLPSFHATSLACLRPCLTVSVQHTNTEKNIIATTPVRQREGRKPLNALETIGSIDERQESRFRNVWINLALLRQRRPQKPQVRRCPIILQAQRPRAADGPSHMLAGTSETES